MILKDSVFYRLVFHKLFPRKIYGVLKCFPCNFIFYSFRSNRACVNFQMARHFPENSSALASWHRMSDFGVLFPPHNFRTIPNIYTIKINTKDKAKLDSWDILLTPKSRRLFWFAASNDIFVFSLNLDYLHSGEHYVKREWKRMRLMRNLGLKGEKNWRSFNNLIAMMMMKTNVVFVLKAACGRGKIELCAFSSSWWLKKKCFLLAI